MSSFDYEEELDEELDEDIEEFDEQEEKKPSLLRRIFRFIKRLLSAAIWLGVILFVVYTVIVLRYIHEVETVEDAERIEHDTVLMKSNDVTNILLIGADTRSADERGRADTVILLSVNSDKEAITMVSFMRDSYVEIPGRGMGKLNASYRYGGAELLMDTLEVNFKIEIDDYVYINFESFSDIVDAVGGIELTVSDAEAQGMRAPMAEVNDIMGRPSSTDFLPGGGTYVMNGNQALAYARLRYVGNADFERTQRQREVIRKIFEKAKTLSVGELDKFLKTCAQSVVTNMAKKDMYLLSHKMIRYIGYDLEELRIPCDDCYRGATIGGQSVLELDFDANVKAIGEALY